MDGRVSHALQLRCRGARGGRHALAGGRGRVDGGDGRGQSRSSSRAARTSSRAAVALPRRPPRLEPLDGPVDAGRRPTPTGAVVLLDQQQADGHRARTSCAGRETKTRLPSDFDIFSPSMRTIAWCIQWRTNGSPVAASDWARSHSWCGKIRSAPPPCRSMVVPSSRRASAEHSMCQPGPARAPERLPRRLVVERRLPQHEVERVALVGVVDVAAPLGGQLEHLLPACSG